MKIIVLISQPKHTLWVLKRTVSMRRFFEQPSHVFKFSDTKRIAILKYPHLDLGTLLRDIQCPRNFTSEVGIVFDFNTY